MDVFEKIKAEFDNAKVPYKVIRHEPVVTSQDAAKIRETSLDMGAKALIFLADGEPIMVVVPGDMKVNTRELKDNFRIKDLRMATGEELESLTELKKGAVPPIGKVFGIPTYFDEHIREIPKVAFNAGSRSVSIIMTSADLIKVEKPIFGSFAEKM